MKEKDYRRLSEDQLLRDNAIINAITEDFVKPIHEELRKTIEGYEGMHDRDKYLSLMRLNEQHAPKGNWLMVDFGYVGRGHDINGIESALPARCGMYDGTEAAHSYIDIEGVRVFKPAIDIGEDFFTSPYYMGEEYYQSLPVCFRIALISNLICRNILTTQINACRYVAGMDDTLEPSRYILHKEQSLMPTHFGQYYGWSIQVRDTTPEDKMMLQIASQIRNAAAYDIEYGLPASDYTQQQGHQAIPLYAEKGQRKPRESTRLLVSFIDEHLPQMGYRVTRSGDGERIRWHEAWKLFSKDYPNRYATEKSFRDSYYNAKRRRGRS